MKKKNQTEINDPSHTFVIAEVGSNWKVGSYEDDLKRANSLIEIAAKCGADAVKFQTYRTEKVYVPHAGQIRYLSNYSSKSINEVFDEFSMPYEMLSELKNLCDEHGIIFMSTPFSIEDAEQVNPFVSIHKVASYEINHVPLLEYLAKTKKPVLVSTGATTFDEIDFAVKILKDNNSGPIGLLQCTSKYPCPFESLNIATLPKIKERYNLPVGLSDHSLDPLIGPILAIGMGATIIEKHFTLDRSMKGPDHSFSLTPAELETMVKAIRLADKAKGDGVKTILKVEEELKQFATRAIQATKKIEKGEKLELGLNFDILRPGLKKRGAAPKFLSQIIGKRAKKTINLGEGISLDDCTKEN